MTTWHILKNRDDITYALDKKNIFLTFRITLHDCLRLCRRCPKLQRVVTTLHIYNELSEDVIKMFLAVRIPLYVDDMIILAHKTKINSVKREIEAWNDIHLPKGY